MSEEGDDRERNKGISPGKVIAGVGLGAAITAIFPPAGIALAAAGFLKSARKYAQTAEPTDALGMVNSSGDVANGGSDDND